MIDIELLVHHLRLRGHQVDSVTVSSAGDFDFMIDGTVLTLADVYGTPAPHQIN